MLLRAGNCSLSTQLILNVDPSADFRKIRRIYTLSDDARDCTALNGVNFNYEVQYKPSRSHSARLIWKENTCYIPFLMFTEARDCVQKWKLNVLYYPCSRPNIVPCCALISPGSWLSP
ncbi:hypothetical protein T310_3245 [Rasamsonia emersonii CBS 393.64]|uniref:Uncharacterized protein n=1 Tax=Rasamsonia emersonii (strain ATCC 16479 / CBS 393.64 / IMI 116815) TaxID=1408163 RepID=A0A0F4YWN5_RASE3|nr:hypothetical protein T310_3245 [Rasamsonia emersonii CBS 393.64]KKA22702.1 hypothetical protein T310_3245 [Rasamsonia emersonii CBS 393.64]